MATDQICATWADICERCAAVYGIPLPWKVLSLGNPDRGWFVRLNAAREATDGIEPFAAHIGWNGFPAGIVDPGGGVIAAGELANEGTFLEWLKTAEASV